MNAKTKNLPATGGEHRIALVTGASGGLGAEMARSLATRGWTVLAPATELARIPEEILRFRSDDRQPRSGSALSLGRGDSPPFCYHSERLHLSL